MARQQKIVFYIVALLIIGEVSSCKKWLDEKPDTSLATPQTLDDLQAMVDNGFYINLQATPSLPEGSADNHFLLPSLVNSREDYRNQYTWQPFRINPSNDWRYGYIPVYTMNVCLEQLDNIPIENSSLGKWNNVKGSALFYRSYFFLQLLWAYSKTYDAGTASSDMGIALRMVSDFNVPSVRASVQECYDQVIDDTKEAVSYLPDMAIHPMRPSKGAAYALLARIYLSMRDYPNALKYSDLCLQLDHQLMDYNKDGDIVSSITGTTQPFKRFNKETIYYSEMNFNYPIILPTNAKCDTTLYASYQSGDLRKIAFFFTDASGYQVFKGSYTQDRFTLFSGIGVDEMYLIRAECLARGGNKDAAMTDLNELLSKRWTTGSYNPPTPSTAAEALDIILKERRKELVFRGLRWMDIKRLNKEGYSITPTRAINGVPITLPPNDNRYALPLPQEIIDITGMAQNPR